MSGKMRNAVVAPFEMNGAVVRPQVQMTIPPLIMLLTSYVPTNTISTRERSLVSIAYVQPKLP